MNINLLCIELAYNFCSISLKKNDKVYYKEYISFSQTTKNVLQAIDLLLLEGNLSFKDVDVIGIGDYPNNLVNLKALTVMVQSLSLTWKIPIIKINSLLTLSFETFLLYKNDFILTLVKTYNNTLIYCNCSFNKDGLLLHFNHKELTNINDLEIKNFKNFIFIMNCEKSIINFIKSNYKFIRIKENILPKAIYTSHLIENFFFNKNELKLNKIKLSYLNVNPYTKYKY